MSARTPLFDPADYFEGRSDSIAGMGVFALYVIVQLLGIYASISLVFDQVENLDPTIEQQAMSMVAGMLFFTAIVLVIGWVVVAAVMHYGTGGSGTFVGALTVAGWAYAPNVIASLPSFLYQRHRIQQLSFDGSDPAQLTSEFQAMQNEMAMSPVSVVLLLLVTGWSMYILTYGVAETHDVPVETAAMSAIFVGLGSILLALFGSGTL